MLLQIIPRILNPGVDPTCTALTLHERGSAVSYRHVNVYLISL